MTDSEIRELVASAKDELKTELLKRIEKTETTLLKEFRKWAVRTTAEIKVDRVKFIAFDERLAMVEERLDELEGIESEGA